MSYYHDRFPRSRGGLAKRQMIRVSCDVIQEIFDLRAKYPDDVTINLPPRGRDCWKSKSLPMAWVREESSHILQEIESEAVSEDYLRVLTFMLRREWFRAKSGRDPDERESWFQQEIRGSLQRLLRSGTWVDSPFGPNVKKLNLKLEKIDLGRRSDLKFSSTQDEGHQKYDLDANRKDMKEAPADFNTWTEADYAKADSEVKALILAEQKPWTAHAWKQAHGV